MADRTQEHIQGFCTSPEDPECPDFFRRISKRVGWWTIPHVVVSYLKGYSLYRMCALVRRIMTLTDAREIQIRAKQKTALMCLEGQNCSNQMVLVSSAIQIHSLIFESRSVCNQLKQVINVLFSGLGNRCIEHILGGCRRLWLLSSRNNSPGHPEIVQIGELELYSHRCQIILEAPYWPGISWSWHLVNLSTNSGVGLGGVQDNTLASHLWCCGFKSWPTLKLSIPGGYYKYPGVGLIPRPWPVCGSVGGRLTEGR